MQIPEKALDEFIEIYRSEFGGDIDRNEAREMAQRVLALYQLLSRKLPTEHNSMQPTGGRLPTSYPAVQSAPGEV